jgi:hypothetical protein
MLLSRLQGREVCVSGLVIGFVSQSRLRFRPGLIDSVAFDLGCVDLGWTWVGYGVTRLPNHPSCVLDGRASAKVTALRTESCACRCRARSCRRLSRSDQPTRFWCSSTPTKDVTGEGLCFAINGKALRWPPWRRVFLW